MKMNLKPNEKIMDIASVYRFGDCFQHEGNFYNVKGIMGRAGKYNRAIVERVM